ncbi:MAG: YciI family protein, partial [Thiobacillus sp.]|nr:YciI family protein [Thiobacillus sp.]
MLYAIVGQDVSDSLNLRLAARPAHVDRLQVLQQAGRLLLAGPFPAIDGNDPGSAGFSGSLIVA